jgi:uncharacterized protein (TIGR03000 family)
VAAPAFYTYGCAGCAAPAQTAPEQIPAPAARTGTPSAGDATVTPRTEGERDAIRRLLQELRKKGKEEEASQSTPQTPASARVTVKLPPDARLWVDQVECPLTSAERSFNTPVLTPGQTYYYTLKMQIQRRGAPVTDSQRVLVSAGRNVTVTFQNPEPITTAQR